MNTPNNPAPTIVEALKAALKPFAETAIEIDERGGIDDGTCPDDIPVEDATDIAITVGQLRLARAALLRAEGESREGEGDEWSAKMLEWLERTRDERNFPAHLLTWCDEAEEHLKAAVAQPHHPTASVEAVARIIDPDCWRQMDRDAHLLPDRHFEEWVKAQPSLAKARAILALTAQQHPGLGSGGPTEVFLVWALKPGQPTIVAVASTPEIAQRYCTDPPPTARGGKMHVETIHLDHAFGARDVQAMIYGSDRRASSPSVATEATGVVPAWQDIRRLLLNDWEGMKEQDFPESILRDWAPDAAEFIRRSPPFPVARATPPSAPIPTEDHEQGGRGSEERWGGDQ